MCRDQNAGKNKNIQRDNNSFGRIEQFIYEGDSISKLQIVIEKNRMEIMTYKQHLFFNIISIQI